MGVKMFDMIATLLLSIAIGQEPSRTWGRAEEMCQVTNTNVNESSGLGASHLEDGLFFTHNDSGDSARFFSFTKDGKVRGEWKLSALGVAAKDWEDMAAVSLAGKAYLLFADIGDNNLQRSEVQIYRVIEPKPDATGGTIREVDTFRLQYPDGRHNAEAFFVDPRTGDFYIVTKDVREAGVYYLPAKPRPGIFVMEKLGAFKLAAENTSELVTGADISPDAKYVAIRTYTSIYEFAVGSDVRTWFKQSRRRIQPGLELQGESIAYSSNGKSLMTTSEGSPCPVNIIQLNQ